MCNEFSRTLTEVNEILNLSDENVIKKIPYEFRQMVVKNMDKGYIPQIDSNKSLEEQNISDKAKDFIALIYKNYIATESEKEILLQKEAQLMQYRKMERK